MKVSAFVVMIAALCYAYVGIFAGCERAMWWRVYPLLPRRGNGCPSSSSGQIMFCKDVHRMDRDRLHRGPYFLPSSPPWASIPVGRYDDLHQRRWPSRRRPWPCHLRPEGTAPADLGSPADIIRASSPSDHHARACHLFLLPRNHHLAAQADDRRGVKRHGSFQDAPPEADGKSVPGGVIFL